PEPARRFRRNRRALLHRCQPGADDDQPDLQRRGRPHAGPDAHLGARAAAVRLAQRNQALAGRLHRQVPGESLTDFELSATQQAVADVVTSGLGARGADDSWEALVDGGVTALPVPERLGGDGVGLPEVATVLTEAGRHGAITPALATLGFGVVPLLD